MSDPRPTLAEVWDEAAEATAEWMAARTSNPPGPCGPSDPPTNPYLAEDAAEPAPVADDEREALGRLVREVWVDWAREQADPKPSWLLPWEALSEPDREVDRRIGETLARRAPVAEARPDGDALADDVRTISRLDENAALAPRLTEAEKYAICKVAFQVYGPLGYAVGNHSSHLTDEIERVLAVRQHGLGANLKSLLDEHWPDSGVNPHYLADLLRGDRAAADTGEAERPDGNALAVVRDRNCDCDGYGLPDDQHASACLGLHIVNDVRAALAAPDGGTSEGS